MRIGIDIQTLETNERTRGIGRLCLQSVMALIKQAPENEYILCGLASDPPESIRSHLNDRVRYLQLSVIGDPREHLRLGVSAPFLWSTGDAARFDLYHVTSPMMPDILLPSAGPCPVVATLLDAIPVIMRERGEDIFDAQGWRRYDQRRNVVRTYQHYLPISECSADDCARVLDLPRDRMTVSFVPIEQRPAAAITSETVTTILNKFALSPGYVVSVTGYHPRKNIVGTIRAFSRLPRNLRAAHPLVLVCGLSKPEEIEINRIARDAGIADTIRITGFVSDEELVVIVKNAAVTFFPSLYEGFGIPPAEAMACGTPVVASNTSSLPEVLGTAGHLHDPDDEASFAVSLKELLESNDLRRQKMAQGFLQVEKFAPSRHVERLLQGYQRALHGQNIVVRTNGANEPGQLHLRVAAFGPLSPCMSGIAEYNEQLLLHLRPHAAIDCYIDDYVPTFHLIREHFDCFEHTAFASRHAREPYDAVLYQAGNNMLHAYLLPYAERYPGVAVLHDYSLLGVTRSAAQSRGSRHGAQLQFAQQYPQANASVWEDDEAANELSFADYPMTEPLLMQSRAIVVHSQWLADRLRPLARSGTRVEVIPLGFSAAHAEAARPPRAGLRKKYLLPPNAFVIASVGVINRFKRLYEVLLAFEEFHAAHPDSYFVLVGPADRFLLRRMDEFCASHRLKHCVRFLGRRETSELYEIIDLADVCVNLRYPTMGESSATLTTIMSMGKPALVTPVDQFNEYPDSVCWKVRLGFRERRELVEYFRYLHAHPEAGEQLGRNARDYIWDSRWDQIAKRYLELLGSVARKQ